MKVRFLGTAAAEGFPAVFCNCAYCRQARKLGGKNIRTRSQTLINDDLLIDFPADSYYHFLQNNIEADKIRYLFITHSHADHLYPYDLYMRGAPYSHDMRQRLLEVYCGSGAYKKICDVDLPLRGMTVDTLKPYQTVTVGEYEVTALPARHAKGEEALFYVVRADKTLLYAHDTGYFYEEVFTYIKENNLVFDMVSLDCTNVDIPITDEGSHMGLANVGRVLMRLEEIGAITEKTVKYINHFSHNGNPLQPILEERAATIGCNVSYDGCVVEL